MENLAEKISSAELEVMKTLWEAEDALPLTDIRMKLQLRQEWSDATVKTLVRRLCEKGAVEQEKRNVFFYRALISRQEYNGWAAKNLVDKLFRGRASELVTALVRSDGLTDDDIQELRDMFRVEE